MKGVGKQYKQKGLLWKIRDIPGLVQIDKKTVNSQSTKRKECLCVKETAEACFIG